MPLVKCAVPNHREGRRVGVRFLPAIEIVSAILTVKELQEARLDSDAS